MLGLADRGLVAGRDCAVIGFDNIAEAAHHRPALTTIEIGARQIGEEAAQSPAPPDQGADRRAGEHRPAAAADHPIELRRASRPEIKQSSRTLNEPQTAGSTKEEGA